MLESEMSSSTLASPLFVTLMLPIEPTWWPSIVTRSPPTSWPASENCACST